MKKILLLFCAAICVVQTTLALTIEDGKYYTIANRNDINLYIKDAGVDIIQMGALDDACYWQFIATGNAGCYFVKNKKTGRYAQLCSTETEVNVTMGDNPVEYRIKECATEGTDMFGLTSTNENNYDFTAGCIGWNWKNDNTVQTFAAAEGTNHRSFWKFTELEPQAITTAGYATYCASEDVVILGAQAYKGTKSGSYLSLSEVNDVPAGSAVVLKGSLFATVATTAQSDMSGNDLKASDGITADGSQYILAEKEGAVAFYLAQSGTTIAAGKAYIKSEAGVKAFYFDADDATSINEELRMRNEESEAAIYNLAGQRISKMQKGINIVGGKKILK